jgi:hypothetical protein
MFWPSLFNTPNIDEILEKAKNIDDILDQENILTGIKSSNTKFAN